MKENPTTRFIARYGISKKKVGLFLCLLMIAFLYTNCHYVKAFYNYPPRDTDYKKFKVKRIKKSPNPFVFPKKINDSIASVSFTFDGKNNNLNTFLKDSETQAFVLIHKDSIIYEFYDYGYDRSSVISVWSVTKVFVSAITRIAVQEGFIKSTDEPIINYLPELKENVSGKVTIDNLLEMNSGINYTGTDFELGPYLHVHYDGDLAKYVLDAKSLIPPGEKFRYSQTDIILLALILRRALDQPLYQYLEEKIWHPLGMEFDAYWMVDNTEQAIERTASGLFASPEDIAKLGKLYLNGGIYNGDSIISPDWVDYRKNGSHQAPFKYMSNFWRHTLIPKIDTTVLAQYLPESLISGTEGDVYSNGANNNKLIYLVPQEDLIIVRFGKGIKDKRMRQMVGAFTREMYSGKEHKNPN